MKREEKLGGYGGKKIYKGRNRKAREGTFYGKERSGGKKIEEKRR